MIDCEQPDARYRPSTPWSRCAQLATTARYAFCAERTRATQSGRRNGLCTLRWFWPHSETRPEPVTTVVAASEVRSFLPADTPTFTPAQRHTEVDARQAHLRWRFRS